MANLLALLSLVLAVQPAPVDDSLVSFSVMVIGIQEEGIKATNFDTGEVAWELDTGLSEYPSYRSPLSTYSVLTNSKGNLFVRPMNSSDPIKLAATVPELVAASPTTVEELDDVLVVGHKVVRLYKINPANGHFEFEALDDSTCPNTPGLLSQVLVARIDYFLSGFDRNSHLLLWNITHYELVDLSQQVPSVYLSDGFNLAKHTVYFPQEDPSVLLDLKETVFSELILLGLRELYHLFSYYSGMVAYLLIALCVGFYFGNRRRREREESIEHVMSDIGSLPRPQDSEELLELIDKTEQLSPIHSMRHFDFDECEPSPPLFDQESFQKFANEPSSFNAEDFRVEKEDSIWPTPLSSLSKVLSSNRLSEKVPSREEHALVPCVNRHSVQMTRPLQSLESFIESSVMHSKIRVRQTQNGYVQEEEHKVVKTFRPDPSVEELIQRHELSIPFVISVSSHKEDGVVATVTNECGFVDLLEVLNDGNYRRQFNYTRTLGRGAFGSVELAQHKLDGQYYAIKKVRMKIVAEQQVNSHKFFKEVKALLRLQYKHVVRYITCWIESDEEPQPNSSFSGSEESWSEMSNSVTDKFMNVMLHIHMEYCDGENLSEWIRSRTEIDAAANYRVFVQLLKGVKYIHAKGVIHRDLKPANVFLDSAGNTKIGDFNLATMFGSESRSSLNLSNVGTPLYLAPEQEQSAHYNNRADLYSIGIILLELFHLFGTEHERLATLRDLRKFHRLAPSFEAEFPVQASLIKWLTMPDPNDRPDASAVLESSLLHEWDMHNNSHSLA